MCTACICARVIEMSKCLVRSMVLASIEDAKENERGRTNEKSEHERNALLGKNNSDEKANYRIGRRKGRERDREKQKPEENK